VNFISGKSVALFDFQLKEWKFEAGH
jgi:hypothetical protein